MNIGTRIKTLRKNKGLNQTELAEIVGLSYTAISAVETNRNEPTSDLIIKLSSFFEVSADYLLTGKEGTNDISEEEREILEFVRKDVDFKKAITQAANLKKKAISYLGNYKPINQHAAIN